VCQKVLTFWRTLMIVMTEIKKKYIEANELVSTSFFIEMSF
jgi:hypothetical protein